MSKLKEFKWLNLFIRDVLLVLVVGVVNYYSNFKSYSVGLITGMLIVWVTWQFNDYLTYKKKQTWSLA